MNAPDGKSEWKEDGMLSRNAVALLGVARAASPPMSSIQRVTGLEGVMNRLAKRLRPQRLPIILALVAGTATATVLVTVAPEVARRSKQARVSLAYQVDGGELGTGGFVRASEGREPTVRFADGSHVKLVAGARGRLTAVDADGARFAIEEGAAEVHVVPRPGAHWSFDAGPFLINVRGTVFTAAWDGAAERLDVRLDKGLVLVTGPLADAPIAVRGGQRLTVALRDREVRLREVAGPGSAESAEAPPVTDGVHRGSRSVALRAQHVAAAPVAARASRSWSEALAAGDLDRILGEAQSDLGHALATRQLEELAALADAARYRRVNDIARRTLLAERRRFPQSRRAHEAAFLLGRLEESDGHARARAIGWYDRYLDEEQSGIYVSEALGRKMMTVQRLYGAARARVVAEEYVRRYPSGTYAGAARALLGHP